MAALVAFPPSPPESVFDDADQPPYASSAVAQRPAFPRAKTDTGPYAGSLPDLARHKLTASASASPSASSPSALRPHTPPSPPYDYDEQLSLSARRQLDPRSADRPRPGPATSLPRQSDLHLAPSAHTLPVAPASPPSKSLSRTARPAASSMETLSLSNAANFGASRARSPRLELGKTRGAAGPHLPTIHSPIDSSHPASSFSARPPSLASVYRRMALFLNHNPVFQTQWFWLIAYFVFNLTLTLYNKGVLVRFPFPWTLTALHALCGSIGGYLLLEGGWYTPARLSLRENLVLVAFSVLYTVNIAVSNLSLQMVTVPFHQVVRATTPIFIIILSTTFLRKRFSRKKLVAQVPLMAGVALSTYGDYYFTPLGLTLTLFGTLLAAAKTVLTHVLQAPSQLPQPATSPTHDSRRGRSPSRKRGHGSVPSTSGMNSVVSRPPAMRLHLHPLDLLARMAPLAFLQCVFYAHLSGELDRVRTYAQTSMTPGRSLALLVNGFLAFGLNVVSFTANKKVGALSITVAANVKQVLTILLAVAIFDLNISSTNGLGIAVTLAAGAWYAWIEHTEKRGRR